jgi:hypothetical protein
MVSAVNMLLWFLGALALNGPVCAAKRYDEAGFYSIAKRIGTDKAGPIHSYYHAYDKYLNPLRFKPIKMLEVGLGCNMGYGPGKSVHVWRELFKHPRFELWEAEYDRECAEKHHNASLFSLLTGDQADVATLQRWVQESGAGFDVIIEDGGHSNRQILNSFTELFSNALKPGGMYFMEDLVCSRHNCCGYQDWRGHIALDVVKGWVDSLVMSEEYPGVKLVRSQKPIMEPVSQLRSIECFRGMCVFHKCPAKLQPGEQCP